MIDTAQLLPNWLAHRAAVMPQQTALLMNGAQWTFAKLDHWAKQLARSLYALGIRPGDCVALLMRNSPDFAALVHAITRIGAVLVPLNIRLAAPELAWQLADASVRLLLYDPHTADLAKATLAHITAQTSTPPLSYTVADLPGDAETAQVPDNVLRDTINLADVFTIIYTSGTTGQPKGALLTYGNYWWSAIGSALNLGTHSDDRWLAVMPLFHVGGLSILIRAAIYGIAAVIQSTFDAAAVNRAIDTEGITIISVVSTMLQRMLDQRSDVAYPAALRCVLLGGGPAPQPLLAACAARGVPVVQTYGLTETSSQVATLAPADALRKLGSAGKPLLPTLLRIEQDGQNAEPYAVGEIVVCGPTVTQGYVNRPDATTQALRDGWLHTGDLGYLDDEGYLYVVSRRNDLIISGGENIYPAEVESALMAHPAVIEAAVVGLHDAQWGYIPAAAVVVQINCELSAEELINFCRQRLAAYKVPRRIRFTEALPRNAAGKLLRDSIRAGFDTI